MLKIYDDVKVKSKGLEYYGYIVDKMHSLYKVYIYGEDIEKWFEEKRLKYVEPIVYDSKKLRQFFRFENIDFSCPLWVYKVEEGAKYKITLDDFLVGLNNAKSDIHNFDTWKDFIAEEIIDAWNSGAFGEAVEELSNDEIVAGFPTERDVFDDLYYRHFDNKQEHIEYLINRIKTYQENIKKPFYEWTLTTQEKEWFVETWDSDEMLLKADKDIIAFNKKCLLELVEDNNESALRILAYSYYSGNKLFNRDSVKARDYLLKLLPYDKDGYYANSLGYIYYYGRCNNGTPQYNEAFKYFSIGNCHGLYESTYKLADMFYNGYGVNKDKKVAYRLVSDIYNDVLHYVIEGDVSKFPDIALRMGNFATDEEVNGCEDYDKAYYYYLQAKYAIDIRKKSIDYVGDDKVAKAIQECLIKTYPQTTYYKHKSINRYGLYDIIKASINCGERILAKLVVKNKNAYLLLSNVEKGKKLYITIPQYSFSGQVEKLKVKLKGYQGHHIFEGKDNTFIFNGQEGEEFYFHDTKVAQISLDGWQISKSLVTTKDKEYKIACCKFDGNDKIYDYICDGNYHIGDKVKVDTPDGSVGVEIEIVNIVTKKESELFLPIKKYKHI